MESRPMSWLVQRTVLCRYTDHVLLSSAAAKPRSNAAVKTCKNIDNKALHDTFSLFGNILSCKVACDPDGKSRGYGFVHYETEEAAKQAIERVNGMQIGESTVFVDFLKKRESKPEAGKDAPYTNLYLKHFPDSYDEEKIKELFKEYGEITSLALMSDAKGRKFAFVDLKESEMAAKAVAELNKKDMRPEGMEAKG